MKLLPRLPNQVIQQSLTELKEHSASPEDALALVTSLSLKPRWNSAGGAPVEETERKRLAEQLRDLARRHGYPDQLTTLGRQQFDRGACRILEQTDFLRAAGPETLRSDCWAGLVLLDVPDLAYWRHGLQASRFAGGNRNFLRRLWLRNRILLLEPEDRNLLVHVGAISTRKPHDAKCAHSMFCMEEVLPWLLIDSLNEDAFVQLIERTSLAADPRLAKTIAAMWLRYREEGFDMERISRLALRRIRSQGELVLLTQLPDDGIVDIVGSSFRRAAELDSK